MIFTCPVCKAHDLVLSNRKQNLLYMVIISGDTVDCIWPDSAEDRSNHFECLKCGTNLPIEPTADALIEYLKSQPHNKGDDNDKG